MCQISKHTCCHRLFLISHSCCKYFNIHYVDVNYQKCNNYNGYNLFCSKCVARTAEEKKIESKKIRMKTEHTDNTKDMQSQDLHSFYPFCI